MLAFPQRQSILAHLRRKCKHYFYFFRIFFKISLRHHFLIKTDQSPGFALITFPRFQSLATIFSASTFPLSSSYSHKLYDCRNPHIRLEHSSHLHA